MKKVKIRGMNLDRENYSKLWDIVDSLSTEFRSGRIKKIIITDNIKIRINTYNTHVFWGRKESVLEIGLPIVVGFSEKEIEHAIALIICKNSKTHTLKDKKIVYTYNKIEQILSKDGCILRSNSVINILILPIMEMLYDFYKKISFIVVRESKINADKLFITKYSADDLTNIILKQYIHTYIIQNVFLKRINKEIEDKGEIPGNIFTLMNEYLNEHISGRDITLALKIIKGSSREGLMFIGSPLNRIEAINSDIDNFQYEFGDNGARFLGKNFEKIEKKFNGLWQKENKKNLKVILDSILKEKKIYDKLCKEFTMFSLGECDFKLYMDLREKFAGANIAIVEGKKICLAYPNNAEIRCMVGKMLINGDNIQGIEYIEAAVKINPFVSLEGYRDIINYYTRKESYDKAEAYQKSYEILEKKCRLAIHERQKPSLSNKSYDKLNLDKDTLLDIRKTLSTKKYIKNAYISKLNVTRFQEISHYILWVNFRLNFFTMEETLNNIDREIQSDVGMNNITVIHLNGDNFYMRYPLKNIKKCKIYSSR